MKNPLFLLLIFLTSFTSFSQIKSTEKVSSEKSKDTVRTEVVTIITSYNPKIANAKKISNSPSTGILEKNKKQQLTYTIKSVPVASTFIPKSGVVKRIDKEKKERIYHNFVALGLGNYLSPFVETSIYQNSRFNHQYGVNVAFKGAFENINSTPLNSTFSSLKTNAFYRKEYHTFDWKVTLDSERNSNNFYGLPDKAFNANTISEINEKQQTNYFNLKGAVNFKDSYFENSTVGVHYFSDIYNSREYRVNWETSISIPLEKVLSDFSLTSSVEMLAGEFSNSYQNPNAVKYNLLTGKIHPKIKTSFEGLSVTISGKLYYSRDSENASNNLLVYPDLKIDKTIIKEYFDFYLGITGDLQTNSYKNLSEINPFVSPTLFITQTSHKNVLFFGLNGKISKYVSFHFKGSSQVEEEKPMFLRNVSKSDGQSTTLYDIDLKGYEYGNSFSVVYDNVKTISLLAEVGVDFTKNIDLKTTFQYNNYQVSEQFTHWNLPTIEASLIANYKAIKWYAGANLNYIGNRNDALYSGVATNLLEGVQVNKAFLDVGMHGGYDINEQFSAFLKLTNVLNADFQRFTNFDVQGFQILAGLTYKFDF